MSTFIISNQSANHLAKTIAENTLFDASKIKVLLIDENVKAYNHRYNKKNSIQKENDFPAYDANDVYTDTDIIDLIEMYQYQCDEHDSWVDSLAYKITEATKKLIFAQRKIAMFEAFSVLED